MLESGATTYRNEWRPQEEKLSCQFFLRIFLTWVRSQVFLWLVDERRGDELHGNVLYVLDFWKEWKQKSRDPAAWSNFAKEWVQINYKKTEQWGKRRAVSQFLSKPGTMVHHENGPLYPVALFKAQIDRGFGVISARSRCLFRFQRV